MKLTSLANRPKPTYRRENGRLVRVKNTASARNAVARKVGIVTGLDSRAVHGALDQRFGFAKAIGKYTEEYQHHVGEDRGIVMADYCRSAGTAKAIRNLALARLLKAGPLDDKDEARAAYESYRKADADLLGILRVLGLEKREKKVEDLNAYIERRYAKRASNGEEP